MALFSKNKIWKRQKIRASKDWYIDTTYWIIFSIFIVQRSLKRINNNNSYVHGICHAGQEINCTYV